MHLLQSMHWGGERKGKPALSHPDNTRRDEQIHGNTTSLDDGSGSNLEDFRKGKLAAKY